MNNERPAESQKRIEVPVDFELELFASEPNVSNPIAMAWDERGRLWVIETVDYPNNVKNNDGAGDDRIKILEDADGDDNLGYAGFDGTIDGQSFKFGQGLYHFSSDGKNFDFLVRTNNNT